MQIEGTICLRSHSIPLSYNDWSGQILPNIGLNINNADNESLHYFMEHNKLQHTFLYAIIEIGLWTNCWLKFDTKVGTKDGESTKIVLELSEIIQIEIYRFVTSFVVGVNL